MKEKIKIMLAIGGCIPALLFAVVLPVKAADIDDLDVTPGSYDFDEVAIDDSKEKRFVLENTATQAGEIITIEDLDITGDDDDQFKVNDLEDCIGKGLDPGEECDIEVEFSPDDTGNMDATLEISIEEDTDVFEVDLEGVGKESEYSVDFSDTSIEFDDTYVDYADLEELEITNTNSNIFTIEDISLQGTDASEFEIDDADCVKTTLTEDESCIVIVLFKPETAGNKSAEIEVEIKDDNEEYLVDIEGDAITKEDGITVTPTSKNLGTFEAGDDETYNFIVESDIATEYEITNVSLKGSDDFKITEDECKGEEIDNGTSGGDVEDRCDITIKYEANEVGFVSAVLEIRTQDDDNPEFNIPMWAYVERSDKYPDDIDDSIFKSYIIKLLDLKIVDGYSDGSFKPNEVVSRGQLAKFIFNAFKISNDTSCQAFPDVEITNTFYKEIMSLKCAGIVTGFSDGSYRPDSPVSRGEVTKFITKALEKKGVDIDLNRTEDFPDVDDTDKFIIYIAYLSSLRFEGQPIIKGFSDGNFKSLRVLTRGEMSKMVYLSMNYYENLD